MPARQRTSLILALAALLLGGCATVPPPASIFNYASSAGPTVPAQRAAFNARVYGQTADWISRRYYDPSFNGADWPASVAHHRPAALNATSDTELYAALNALLAELRDEHTHALSPLEIEQWHRRRSFLLGFRSDPAPGQPKARRILAVFPDSPAARAGVQPGWILLAADDRPPMEVLGVGKLADGQLVRCEFLDALGQPRHLELRAEKLEYPPVRESRMLPGDVLLLTFDRFDLPAARWLRAELKRHRPAGGVVLDLRGNAGGEARALAAIVAELFPGRVDLGAVRGRGTSDAAPRRSPSHPFAAHYDGPLAVLVSEASASAAEIFASVVQREHRGAIVGTATAGNVLVCVHWPLPGGGQLQLSVYDYVGPDGLRLEGRGIAPDVVVEPAPGVDPDPQLEAALRSLHPTPPARP
jgi:carboxyl-terminal processing protease